MKRKKIEEKRLVLVKERIRMLAEQELVGAAGGTGNGSRSTLPICDMG
jgi:hypothetical protein